MSAAALKSQEPDRWPQDDDDSPQQQADSGVPQYPQPQPYDYGQSGTQQGYYGQRPGYGQQLGAMPAQGMDAQQLEQLVAPIALYPDTLVAQILAASTYPAQIAAADPWVRAMGGVPPEQIAAGANMQPWDPSVKALTAYPQVLSMLNQNLQWTTALGNAYYNQPQDVTETIQVLRQRAQSAGNLQSTPQQQVTSDQGYIAVAPANPEVVYVPTYNPWVAYGQPIVAYPGYAPIDAVGAFVGGAVQLGLQFAVGAFFHFPFGFVSWGLDWMGHAVLFNHGVWCSRSGSVRDWGFPHGGPRYFRGGEWAHGGGGWGGGYGRGGYYGYGRGGYGRDSGYGRGSLNAYRNAPGFNRGGGQYPVARAGGGYGRAGFGRSNPGGYDRVARPGGYGGEGDSSRGSLGYNSGYSRGFLGSGTHPSVPQQYAFNHGPSPAPLGGAQPYRGNPQFNANRGYGSGAYPRPSPSFGGGRSFRVPSQTYRSPISGFGGNSGRSGGFQPFGGGHRSTPSFGGGHSFGGGGHSAGGFGGGHSFSGGGHSFGGGGHSSGGGGPSGGGGHGHHR